MRVVIQRVKQASVTVEGIEKCSIQKGLLLLVGVEDTDNEEDIKWLSKKVCNLRIFDDKQGVMNLSVIDDEGDIIAVSQFTLHARVKKGNRPSYVNAARPEIAEPMYKQFVKQLENDSGKSIGEGVFGAEMLVELVNDGPVTIMVDSKNRQ